MPAQAIDNTNLLQQCFDCGAVGFVPSVTFTYDGADVVVTNASTIPSGDTLSKVHLRLIDQNGKEVRGTITSTAVTLSASTLDKSGPLTLRALVITTKRIHADGGNYNIQPVGAVGHWDVKRAA